MQEKTAILGPGLLGGSLALALYAKQKTVSVWGRRQAPLDVLSRGCPDLQLDTSLKAVVADATLIVLATPIGVMPEMIRQILAANNTAERAIITDVGSVKGPLVRVADDILASSQLQFVGSHPMAGSEASGVEAARADLFEGAMCILTPTSQTKSMALKHVHSFWQALGCRLQQLDLDLHDQVVAHVSHVPHLLASLVVDCALTTDPSWADFGGGGLRDTTRIASGEPGMWAEILMENRTAVLDVLQHGRDRLSTLMDLLKTQEKADLYRFLLETKELRDTRIVPCEKQGN